MGLLTRLRSAGFSLEMFGEYVRVSPAERLTDEQRAFLVTHKSKILAELRQRATANDSPALTVECWTPAGGRMLIRADSPAHAEQLRRWNPKPKRQKPDRPSLGRVSNDEGLL